MCMKAETDKNSLGVYYSFFIILLLRMDYLKKQKKNRAFVRMYKIYNAKS